MTKKTTTVKIYEDDLKRFRLFQSWLEVDERKRMFQQDVMRWMLRHVESNVSRVAKKGSETMTEKEFSETEVNEIISRVVKVPGTMKDYQIQLVLEGFKAGQENKLSEDFVEMIEQTARQDERKKVLDYESLLDSEENDRVEHDDAGREE